MRSRTLVATVLLLLPVALSAQRMPRLPGARRPIGGEPLPPQPAVIAQKVQYQRSKFSFETYPMISFLQTPAAAGLRVRNGLTIGAGSRVEYRLTRFVAATADVTSSSLGANATHTAEFGTRFRPERSERRFDPFFDLRGGYIRASESLMRAGDVIDTGQPSANRYSAGFGAIAGAGLETGLSRQFSLITSASVLRGRVRAYDFRNMPGDRETFSLTSYRVLLGVRYNPTRLVTAQMPAGPQGAR